MAGTRELVLKSYAKKPGPVIDTTITNLMDLLSVNSYQKGAWVLHMLRNEIGNESFLKGLRLFYDRYRNSNALTDDFKHVMEEVSGKELTVFFRQWLWVPGQPELKISTKRSDRSGTTEIKIEQKQKYLFDFSLDLLLSSANGEHREKVHVTERVTNSESSLCGD